MTAFQDVHETPIAPFDGAGEPDTTARLLVSCADRPGSSRRSPASCSRRARTSWRSQQHSTDPSGGRFFLRMEFALDDLAERRAASSAASRRGSARGSGWTGGFATPASVRAWRSSSPATTTACSTCCGAGAAASCEADVTLVISNHPDLGPEAAVLGVPFHHVPVERGAKAAAEERVLELLAGQTRPRGPRPLHADPLAATSSSGVGAPVINIHHSFLPAFAGADPYRRARERGVKLIGATAHYVTEELDAGPIIEQDVVRVDHRESVAELERMGRDIERGVLARAVMSHLDDRVVADGGRTVVF